MNDAPLPRVTRSKPFPLVWIVPFVALLLGAYLIARELRDRGPSIRIAFEEGRGLRAGETELRYKGVTVGRVQRLSLSEDLQGVVVEVALQKSATGLAREGSQFWILRPEISLGGIRGLDTLISGPTLQVAPGAGSPATEFIGSERPPVNGEDAGARYLLRRHTLGSIKVGSPIMYKEVKVGEVVGTRLADDATAALVEIAIETPFRPLVRTNSVFWDASGIAMKVGLLGARIQTQSLEAILAGGIQFATPEGPELADIAPDGAEFALSAEADDEWTRWAPLIPLN